MRLPMLTLHDLVASACPRALSYPPARMWFQCLLDGPVETLQVRRTPSPRTGSLRSNSYRWGPVVARVLSIGLAFFCFDVWAACRFSNVWYACELFLLIDVSGRRITKLAKLSVDRSKVELTACEFEDCYMFERRVFYSNFWGGLHGIVGLETPFMFERMCIDECMGLVTWDYWLRNAFL